MATPLSTPRPESKRTVERHAPDRAHDVPIVSASVLSKVPNSDPHNDGEPLCPSGPVLLLNRDLQTVTVPYHTCDEPLFSRRRTPDNADMLHSHVIPTVVIVDVGVVSSQLVNGVTKERCSCFVCAALQGMFSGTFGTDPMASFLAALQFINANPEQYLGDASMRVEG